MAKGRPCARARGREGERGEHARVSIWGPYVACTQAPRHGGPGEQQAPRRRVGWMENEVTSVCT